MHALGLITVWIMALGFATSRCGSGVSGVNPASSSEKATRSCPEMDPFLHVVVVVAAGLNLFYHKQYR